MSLAYHPKTNSQTKVANKCLKIYLRCMYNDVLTSSSKWIYLAEWWYNINHHTTIVKPYLNVFIVMLLHYTFLTYQESQRMMLLTGV